MSGHYYSEKPEVKSSRQTWEFPLKGHTFRFTTDRGVFSKKEVDFGSRVLIEAFRAPEVDGDFADIGCGYGPIGLSLAKVEPERKVIMVDVNERALDLALLNAANNGVSNVSVKKSSLLDQVESNLACVISNPPIRAGKQVVHSLFEQAYEKLKPGGELWIVIQKKQGAPSALEKIDSLFGNSEVVEKKKGYYIIMAQKNQ
ncbi:class I SAM-dependent methyltransferase [Fictibacillus aquaticus]|uniref:16S rRNA methyltransferase n=1 Tax=Fictibacillus aquaticus TaxID=2021314 RepID=A0A235F789_9BACL|nr:class I SAM-dependent methyltransferase [Fictibacillus aquaticus]OYD57082.1 16S rRNA methyltransferase [Fictibacillus aquaticus]